MKERILSTWRNGNTEKNVANFNKKMKFKNQNREKRTGFEWFVENEEF